MTTVIYYKAYPASASWVKIGKGKWAKRTEKLRAAEKAAKRRKVCDG